MEECIALIVVEYGLAKLRGTGTRGVKPSYLSPWSFLHYFSVFTPVVNWRHAIIFLEKLTKIVNIIIANAV